MYQFDVKYTFDNYYEYYNFVLIKQRIFRDLMFSLLFVAVAAYWLIDQSESTTGYLLPIFAFVMAVAFPLMNFATIPMLKKQLRAKQSDIDRTHLMVTFNDDEVIYENLSEDPAKPEEPVTEEAKESPVSEEVKEEATEELKAAEPAEAAVTAEEEPAKEETPATEEAAVTEEKPAEETTATEEAPAEEPKEETKPEEEKKEEKTFKLQYSNFSQVREIQNLFLFFLDRQTTVILPKNCLNGDIEGFKSFILSKVNPKRVKFLKK